MILLLALAVPSYAEGPALREKTIKLHMNYFGNADIWILHKVNGCTVNQAALRLSANQNWERTFTTPKEMDEGDFYLLINFEWSGLWKAELNEKTEKMLLEKSFHGSTGVISLGAITEVGKRLDE